MVQPMFEAMVVAASSHEDPTKTGVLALAVTELKVVDHRSGEGADHQGKYFLKGNHFI